MQQFRLIKRFTAFLLVASMALSMTACGGDASPTSSSSSQAGSSQTSVSAEPSPSPTPAPEPAPVSEPDADLLAKINNAYNQNNDVVGWLSIDGTTIDGEVLQAEDNKVYERSDITKGYNWYGCYYADYENTFGDRNSISQNTIIYGHNMSDNPEDVRFSQLMKYLDIDFARTHPYIRFSTPEDDMMWKVFAVLYTDTNFPFNHATYPTKTLDFIGLVAEFRDRSQFEFDVDVNESDKLLTLSTCTYKFGNREDQRYLVVARLVRPDEKIDEATVGIEINPAIKPPQFS